MSAYHVSLIQPLPVPKVERGVDGRCAMQWYMQFPHALPADEFDMIVQQAKHPHISFSSQVQGASAAVQVRFSEGDYTTAYDATWQVLRHLEERLGPVETLEGAPRTIWKMQLVINRHVRPKERA